RENRAPVALELVDAGLLQRAPGVARAGSELERSTARRAAARREPVARLELPAGRELPRLRERAVALRGNEREQTDGSCGQQRRQIKAHAHTHLRTRSCRADRRAGA